MGRGIERPQDSEELGQDFGQ